MLLLISSLIRVTSTAGIAAASITELTELCFDACYVEEMDCLMDIQSVASALRPNLSSNNGAFLQPYDNGDDTSALMPMVYEQAADEAESNKRKEARTLKRPINMLHDETEMDEDFKI